MMRRRALLLAAAVAASACAVPAPCTRALCPTRVEGAYRLHGWKGDAVVTPLTPPLPITSDVEVRVLSGDLEFVNNDALVRAVAGADFHIEVSTAPMPIPELYVSSGSVIVAQRPGQPFVIIPPGTRWLLPRSPKAVLHLY
ncbi:MAG: hypothetical protein HKL90_01470 [Elusimicrobia bacterium]|nr:hypothetical protein [Elusimicrobiota bacterium]